MSKAPSKPASKSARPSVVPRHSNGSGRLSVARQEPETPIAPSVAHQQPHTPVAPSVAHQQPAGSQSAPRAHTIHVRGAREHNLKNVDLEIPRDKLIVFTGLSGSGKSSLAFDTIYAEGQRRYVESLSAYARQFLEMMQKPDVDHIDGLSPAISIEQKTTSKNPRSTVGTVTEIYDYLRLLFARVGVPYSPATGLPIESQTVTQMVDKVLALPEGSRVMLMAPVVRGRKGEYRKELAEWQKKGFARVKVNGTVYDISEAPKLDKKFKHDIDVVVDRLVVRPDIASRLADSFETALALADGIAIAELVDKPLPKEETDAPNRSKNDTHERIVLSQRFACPVSGFTIEEIEPRIFSFNAPAGACPKCDGLGTELRFEADLVVPDRSLSLEDGAIWPWARTGNTSPYYQQTLQAIALHYRVSMAEPFEALPKSVQDVLLFGSGDEEIEFAYEDGLRTYRTSKAFEGVIGNIERRWRETDSEWVKEELSRYQGAHACEACSGYRLKPQSLAVKVGGRHIGEVSDLSIRAANDWFRDVPATFTPQQGEIAGRILKEIRERLQFLVDVGLDYLTLSRASGTLSGGESQRIRLASQIGSGLTGVLYVLDEPSIGLHQRDNARLLVTLRHLRDLGNTVLVVEHDEDAILTADYVVDIGPGAGVHGGQIIAQGTPDQVMANPASLTADYLTGRRQVPLPKVRRKPDPGRTLRVVGARENNLQNVTAAIPLGVLTCVTGVSGGGKSTFLIDTVYKAVARKLNGAREAPGRHERIEGLEHLDKVIDIDQSPIGRTPRSNPATYTGAFTPIRDWFAGLPLAKTRGYGPGRFSFNVKGGRCEACQGDGVLKIEMHFLPDVYVTCDQCKGRRYNRETLEVLFREKSIADVLDMTVEEGVGFFAAVPSIRDKLETLHRVGLGYIKIGQQATTLSGGEAQRIKLAKELARRATGRTLYILDEPTTGLHFHDVAKLLEVLHELADAGNTVVVIEHNLEVIKTADWIIDMGPEGGDGGGKVVAEGTPEQVAAVAESYTGQFLKELLARRAGGAAGAMARGIPEPSAEADAPRAAARRKTGGGGGKREAAE
jgi:excinuclease ABC subunit A